MQYVSNQNVIFFFNYFNALLLTIFGILVFTGLILYYYQRNQSFFVLTGLFFIPIYGLMNIFAYGSQITIIPALLSLMEIPEYEPTIKVVILLFTQIYEGTIVSTINLSAYGILAIPTILLSKELLIESDNYRRLGGLFFLLSGVTCLISIGGLFLLEYSVAGVFSVIGGFLTLFGQIPLAYTFLKE